MAFAFFLGLILRWLAAYSSESRNANSSSLGWEWGGWLRFLSRDTTVSAYARQTQQHAQENDAHAARLMETVKVEDFAATETKTEARTEVPKPL